jgi:ABC-2 type transport system ATP-binding protein
VLNATNLTRRFSGRLAVDRASLTLERGRILALLGPNGAGKTTTLRMLAGLIRPDSGDVTINGSTLSPATASALRGHIGFLTEAPGLWDRLTVWQNLIVYARLQGVSDPGHAVRRVLGVFGLTERAEQKAAQLSKGLRQRVALARTLLHEPEIVLLDEPTSGLDPESARGVRDLILNLKADGRAVLLSTHNLAEVERVADTVGVLRTRLVALDTPAALRERLFGPKLRISLAGDAAVHVEAARGEGVGEITANGPTLEIAVDDVARQTPAVVRRLVVGGADVLSVVPIEPSLEEVYLRVLEGDDRR